jgi:hypothetical protein
MAVPYGRVVSDHEHACVRDDASVGSGLPLMLWSALGSPVLLGLGYRHRERLTDVGGRRGRRGGSLPPLRRQQQPTA